MVELIEPPDAETIAIDYLARALAVQPGFERVAVAGSLPTRTAGARPPDEVVVVRSTGTTPRDLVVTTAQLTFTSWARGPQDEVRAGAIARRVQALVVATELLGAMGETPCYRVQAPTAPYPDPDPVTARARYSATYLVDLRGSVLPIPFNPPSP